MNANELADEAIKVALELEDNGWGRRTDASIMIRKLAAELQVLNAKETMYQEMIDDRDAEIAILRKAQEK